MVDSQTHLFFGDKKMNAKILRRREVAENFLGCSPRTIDRMVASGRLPQPIRLSSKTLGWTQEMLDDWLAAERSKAEAVAP